MKAATPWLPACCLPTHKWALRGKQSCQHRSVGSSLTLIFPTGVGGWGGGEGREGGGRWLLLQVGSQPLPPHLYLISGDSPVLPVPGLDPRQGAISPPSPKQRATKERHSKRPRSAVTETLFSRERLRKWFEQPYYKIKMYPPTP